MPANSPCSPDGALRIVLAYRTCPYLHFRTISITSLTFALASTLPQVFLLQMSIFGAEQSRWASKVSARRFKVNRHLNNFPSPNPQPSCFLEGFCSFLPEHGNTVLAGNNAAYALIEFYAGHKILPELLYIDCTSEQKIENEQIFLKSGDISRKSNINDCKTDGEETDNDYPIRDKNSRKGWHYTH